MTRSINHHCYVLSGGVGSRLWPLSRADQPKQFHNLTSDQSLLQETVERMHFSNSAGVTVISSNSHADLVRKSLDALGFGEDNCILEPVGRNTAPAVALATLDVISRHGDGLVLVTPADAHVSDPERYWSCIEAGSAAAEGGAVVVLGIPPTRAETGYGYIEAEAGEQQVVGVRRFVEKPDLETAQTYLKAGNFFWNAGIFIFQASMMRQHFEELQPEMWEAARRSYDAAQQSQHDLIIPHDIYAQVPADSIDFAIMEKVSPIALVKTDFEWSDVGSWQSLYEITQKDAAGNHFSGDVFGAASTNSYIRSNGPFVGVYGVDNLAVVATPDAVFVSPLSETQNVREIVGHLEKLGRLETQITPEPRQTAPDTAPDLVFWLKNSAFPFWRDRGVDPVHGGFHEVLDFDGNSLKRDKRLRTMARQTFCFAKAQKHSWLEEVSDCTAHGLRYLEEILAANQGHLPKVFSHDGSVVDDTEDLYDVAFVLLAASAALDAGHGTAKALGDRIMEIITERFYISANLGFRENAVDTGGTSDLPRRSNPHMHLFEAMMAWYRASGSDQAAQYSSALYALFHTRFLDAETGTLIEFFDRKLDPLPGKNGRRLEPGHQYEWTWLLHEYAETFGKEFSPAGDKLFAHSETFCRNSKTGLVYQVLEKQVGPIDSGARSWSQAEAIRAALAMKVRRGGMVSTDPIQKVGDLFKWHINPAPEGCWMDAVNDDGVATTSSVPASILYHLVIAGLAINESQL